MTDKNQTERNHAKTELNFYAYGAALELLHPWQDYYSKWFTFDEYAIKILNFLEEAFYDIKEDIENTDNEE